MIHPQRFMPAVVVLVLCSAFAHAQTPAQTSETNKELREKAINLLESAAGQVNILQSAENRARIAANIADSLWTHDEKRARSLFALVESDITAGLNREDPQKPRDSQTFDVFLKLRADTIERIAKYDPELALAFLKSTGISPYQKLPHRVSGYSDEAVELRLAKQIAASNPDAALKIGRESLARGLSDDLLIVLRQLSRKHKEHTRTLYKEIVTKVRDVNFYDDWRNRQLIQRLTLSFSPPVVDESTFRELQSVLITKAFDVGCQKTRNLDDYDRVNFCQWVFASLPQGGKMDARAAELKHWTSEIDSHGNLELEMVAQDGTVDEILALSGKYPQMESAIAWRAFEMARASGDVERAREIATASTNPNRRQGMLDQLEKSDSSPRNRSAEIEEKLQTTLNELPTSEDRFWFVLSVVDQFVTTDRNSALKLLNQASDMAETLQPGWQHTVGQMGLALMFCYLKNDRCFQIMETLMPKFNQLVDAAAKLDGFDTHYLRDGEWNMSSSGKIGDLLTGLSQHAAHFAWCDFDRAVSLSNQFERTEIRLMAQVKLAQGILAGPPPSIFSNFATRSRH